MTPTATVTLIPFSRLVAPDAINARTQTKDGLDELAASIQAKGIIQPLSVRPADGDKYEVIDGRRRYQALAKLVKSKHLSKKFDVPVSVRNEDDASALETSLMANTVRLPMHPVDQHEVFARLIQQGRSEDDIGASFGISAKTVKQHLALSGLAPELRAAWKAGKIDAKIAQAFTVHQNHEVQAAAYAKLKKQGQWGLSETNIKSELLGGHRQTVQECAEIAVIGLEAYLAAGGAITDSLFEDERYVADQALAKKLAGDAVLAECDALMRNGWAWAEPEQSSIHTRSNCTYVRGEDEDEVDDLAAYTPDERALSGVLVSYNHKGKFTYEPGLIKTADDGDNQTDIEDAFDGAADAHAAAATDEHDDESAEDYDGLPSAGEMTGSADAPDHDGDGEVRISQALAQTLSEIETIATADALATDASLAMRVITAALLCKHSAPAVVRNEGHASVRGEPGRQSFHVLLSTLINTDDETAATMFAGTIATTLDLTVTRWGSKSPARAADVTALVGSVNAETYTATARARFVPADYFARAPKTLALAAIEDMRAAGCAPGTAPAEALEAAKKSEAAAIAAVLALDCGWLPPQLRVDGYSLSARS